MDAVLQPSPGSHTAFDSSTRLNGCREEGQLRMEVLFPSLARFDQLHSLRELAHVGSISMYTEDCLNLFKKSGRRQRRA